MMRSLVKPFVAAVAVCTLMLSAFAGPVRAWGTYWEAGMVGHEVGNFNNTVTVVASNFTPEGWYNQLNVGGVDVFFDAPTGNYLAPGGGMIVTPVRDEVSGSVTITVDVVGQSVVEYIDWINADL